jgi:hypothetical protein
MRLKSALDDLQETTLQAITGCLRRLEYVSNLRDRSEQEYAHWGLARVYGVLQSRRAFAQAHRSLVSEILSTPIRTLVEDAEQSSESTGVAADAYIERLTHRGGRLLPASPGAGSARHLNSVLHALSGLTKVRREGAIRRAS